MTTKTNLVKSSLLALGIGAALAAPAASQAQTLSIVYSGGGSSALQGSYAPTAIAKGAIPTLLTDSNVTISGFSDSTYTVTGILEANVTIQDPSGDFTDTPAAGTPAIIIYSKNGTSYKAVVLVRSDSGFGIRYAANLEKITAFVPQTVTVSGVTTTATFFTFAPNATSRAATADDTTVEGLLTTPITLYNGLSDVSADSIVTYSASAGFGIGTASTGHISLTGLQGATQDLLPIQTLLFLYNSSKEPNGHHLNVSRTMAKSLIAGLPGSDVTASGPYYITWNEVDATLTSTGAVDAYFREKSSGTRTTELLDVQRFGVNGNANLYLENQFGYNPVTASATGNGYGVLGSNNANGTGAMVNAVNSDTNGFGYAFVTGSAGNGKASVNVATYDGVAPFSFATYTNGIPTSADYSGLTSTFYTAVANGTYEAWSYANQYEAANSPQASVASTIATLLGSDNTETLNVVHSLGFTSINDMSVVRVGNPSSYSTTGATDYDGQLITFDVSGTAISDTGNAIQ